MMAECRLFGTVSALLVMLCACGENTEGGKTGAPSPTGHTPNAGEVEASGTDGAPVAVAEGDKETSWKTLPTADEVGLEGWQGIDYGRDDWTALEGNALADEGAIRRVAETRPGLSVVPDEDGAPRLTGLVEPGDTEAMEAVLSSAGVRMEGMAGVPPVREIRSLAGMAAAVASLVGVEPSANAIIGEEADDGVRARLERAASAWPMSARVWRVIGAPPDSRLDADISFDLEAEPEDRENVAALRRRLQGMGILEFEPVADRGLINAHVSFYYQNSAQHDRELYVEFVYDVGTDQWILRDITSVVSEATAERIFEAEDPESANAKLAIMHQTIDILSVLPECHIVVGPDGPLLCK